MSDISFLLNTITGNIVDVVNRKIFPARLQISQGKITAITKISAAEASSNYILPGFIDAHVHIESSMLSPCEFARMAVVHGTLASVSDPHEIGNVLGVKGVKYMIENAQKTPFKCYFGAPSCVPATNFETAGATITAQDIDDLFTQYPNVNYLSEMMNYPGVLNKIPLVMDKIAVAKKHNKPIDGHAPGLMGADAANYVAVGISTDHECFTLAEGRQKAALGMKILIREGSAAKNFEALHPLFKEYPKQLMFCSDDKHPDDLLHGHINQLVQRAVALGYNIMDVLHAACVLPVQHYGLDVGLLQTGDAADFIVVNNLSNFEVEASYIDGRLVAENGKTLLDYIPAPIVNNFNCSPKKPADFNITISPNSTHIKVIKAIDGQLITEQLKYPISESKASQVSIKKDILKIAVVNRYTDTPISIGFIQGFGLKHGAIASTVAHDSHNIIAVGTNNTDICNAVNTLIKAKGGLSAVSVEQKIEAVLPLPIAGLISDKNAYTVAKQYTQIDKLAKQMGSTLYAPYMSLSFMGLLVIPSLKMSDLGLFDGSSFNFVDVFE